MRGKGKRRSSSTLKIAVLRINSRPHAGIRVRLLVLVAAALMHASVISEVVMQIRMEKFPGLAKPASRPTERHRDRE